MRNLLLLVSILNSTLAVSAPLDSQYVGWEDILQDKIRRIDCSAAYVSVPDLEGPVPENWKAEGAVIIEKIILAPGSRETGPVLYGQVTISIGGKAVTSGTVGLGVITANKCTPSPCGGGLNYFGRNGGDITYPGFSLSIGEVGQDTRPYVLKTQTGGNLNIKVGDLLVPNKAIRAHYNLKCNIRL